MEKESTNTGMAVHCYQDLMDRHFSMLSLLKETAKEVLDLRQENVNLKMANADLTSRLAFLIKSMSSNTIGWFGYSVLDPNENLGSGVSEFSPEVVSPSPSPTSVVDSGGANNGDVDCVVVHRISLPKSISVRSNEYSRTVKSCPNQKQKHVVPGVEKGKEQLEQLEVYNQGMLKTELCNKWQETGACPYGDHCQFAHGINELRPVLRHPLYKTDVCRMVLNGDPCPYGHRCHFRHTLTDQEKLMKAINLIRSRKARNC